MVLAFFQVLLVLLSIIHSTNAFSVSSSSDGGINIVGLGGGQTQSLPGMYVKVSWLLQHMIISRASMWMTSFYYFVCYICSIMLYVV